MEVVYHEYLCDTCDSKIKGAVEALETQVVFHTEQNEGLPSKPYKSLQSLHLCPACYERSLLEVVQATGAQGNNKYFFIKDEC